MANADIRKALGKLTNTTDIGLHLKNVRGVAGAEPSRLPGSVEEIKDQVKTGVLQVIVTGQPASFPTLQNRIVTVDIDEIVAFDLRADVEQ